MIDRFDIRIVPFDYEQAILAAKLREATKVKGLSFADRACLALAPSLSLPVLTADRKWSELSLDLDVCLIR